MRFHETKLRGRGWILAAGLSGLMLATATGCQVDVGGQTLPSPYYWQDDVQYFPAGPEFKLTREAADLKEKREREKLEAQR
jgi:hypothetical protein